MSGKGPIFTGFSFFVYFVFLRLYRAKRVYILFFGLIFIFCKIKLIFGRLTCFDMKSIVLLFFYCCFGLRFREITLQKNSVLQAASLGVNLSKVDFDETQS